jgi:Cadmium resistance transporter
MVTENGIKLPKAAPDSPGARAVTAQIDVIIAFSSYPINTKDFVAMDSLVNLIGLAIVAFTSTNIDDVFVLVGFFADKNFRPHDVVISQYARITALYVIAAIAGLISLVIPPAYLGLLGLAPIGIGIKKLYALLRNQKTETSIAGTERQESSRPKRPPLVFLIGETHIDQTC